MRSQEEEAIFNQWRNEDVAHENAVIEEAMREQERADRAMELARDEAMYDQQIQEAISANCKSDDHLCSEVEYFCQPNGVWCCKKCGATTDI